MSEARARLAALLVAAYSGERAAALAYRGHWRASGEPDERDRIRRIEEDEWQHRRSVGGMLARLGAAPSARREFRSRVVGRLLGALCPGGLSPARPGPAAVTRRRVFDSHCHIDMPQLRLTCSRESVTLATDLPSGRSRSSKSTIAIPDGR